MRVRLMTSGDELPESQVVDVEVAGTIYRVQFTREGGGPAAILNDDGSFWKNNPDRIPAALYADVPRAIGVKLVNAGLAASLGAGTDQTANALARQAHAP